MTIEWSKITPVLVSIAIIIFVAIIRSYSKTIAAIAATMPINVPLGLWIVYAGTEPDKQQAALSDFSEVLLINIFPTVGFLVAAWLATRAGNSLVPTILIGYAAWAVLLVIVLVARAILTR